MIDASVRRDHLRGSPGPAARVNVLIVGGPERVRRMLAATTSGRRFDVVSTHTIREAAKSLRSLRPEVVLIDAMLPGKTGIELCRYVRQGDSQVVIVLFSPEVREGYRVGGFEAGADDYLTWPFGGRELVCRIEAKLRRSSYSDRPEKIEAGNLRIDTRNRTTHLGQRAVSLRPKEFDLLVALASSDRRIKPSQELIGEVWGEVAVDRRALHAHVSHIRAALSRHSGHEYIECVRGLGYRFRPDVDTALRAPREAIATRNRIKGRPPLPHSS